MKISMTLGLGTAGLGVLLIAGCILDNQNKTSLPPSGFSYSTSAAFYAPGVPIVNDTPFFETGTARHYSVSPALPSGLFLDTATGVISGTPGAEAATASYVITAKSDTIALAASVSITVSRWIGLPVDSIKNAMQLLVNRSIPIGINGHVVRPPEYGNLYVANRSSTKPGILLVDTATSKIRAYYAEQLPPESMVFTSSGSLVVTETNYAQGSVSVFNESGRTFTMSFGSDNAVASAIGRTYLIDHTTGVVTGFQGETPNQDVMLNVQTGANSNPSDVASSDNRVYVTRYNSKSLLVLDGLTLGGGVRDSIDLSQFSSHHPADTIASTPRMAWVTAHNGYLFVALQRLSYNYSARDTAVVVVISPGSKQIIATIPLHFKNPISAHVVGGMWYLTGIANYDQSGGVEKIDLDQQKHGGEILSAQSLSADVFDFAPTGDHSGFVSYSTDYGITTKVKKVSY